MPYYRDVIPLAEYVGKQYQPSNGTEGEMFFESWCTKCKRDKHMNGTSSGDALGNPDPDDFCRHLNESFHGDGTPEWVFGADGWPMCKQFLPMDAPDDVVRDELTIDMFAEAAP